MLLGFLYIAGIIIIAGIDKERYFANVPRWSEISLNAMATKLSPSNMDVEKGKKFYTLCYYGSKD